MSALTRRRALRAIAPVAGLLAAGLLVWQGSYAAFSSTTDTAASNWATGQVELKNNSNGSATFNASGAAVFTANGLRPGDAGSRCITVRSTGTAVAANQIPANTRFYVTSLGGALAPGLNLKVEYQTLASGAVAAPAADCSTFAATGTVVADGPISGAPGSWAAAGAANQWVLTGVANENRVYKISWSFPSTAGDNSFQGTSATAVFNWQAQS